MIINKFKVILIFIVVAFGLSRTNAYAGKVKLTVKVVDEVEKTVEGANVRMCFYGGCLKKDATKGVTDDKGLFVASGPSPDGQVGGAVEKTGYYNSMYHHDFHRNILGVWQPFNKKIKVVLRPIIKPVPMYVRDKWIKIPVVDKEIGFDLIKFDWVIPYGQGTESDFIFLVNRQFKNMNDFEATLNMTFSNEFDGIQEIVVDRGGDFGVGSEFKLPRYAPESGYRRKLVKKLSTKSPDFYALKEKYQNYFFRVRSEVDEKGNLKRAMYGKITDEITIDPRGNNTGEIHIRFYLNPDYTKNLEYDPDVNLFGPLPKGEVSTCLP